MHSRDIIFVVLLVANIMPKEKRCLDGAKFPNKTPPTSQMSQSLEMECHKVW
jgi:hypothetical protein